MNETEERGVVFVEEILSHHGVKGQKWGTRKERRREHQEWSKSAKSPETANKVYQDAAKTFGPVLKKLNKDPAFSDMATNSRTRRDYDAVVSTIFNKHLVDASAQTFNPKLNRAMIYQMTADGTHMRAIESELVGFEHADLDKPPDFELIRDADGYIIGVKVVESSMSQSDIFINHHGVKGQKWGVRKKRPSSEDSSKHRSASKKRLNELSDKELKDLVGRMNMEQQAKRLNPGKVAKGYNVTKGIVGVMGTVTAIAAFASSPVGKRVGKALKRFGTPSSLD